ncbi:MAG: peptidase M16 [Terriglobia bacterium]|nr:MAG: peptidase M16 [Terriglobia bacterium]
MLRSESRSFLPVIGIRFCALILLCTGVLPAQILKEFEKKVTEFTLPNGLHFIVAERHEAPVVSFHTYVGAGSVDDPSGSTGIAHMFEHMAFKGTETIGTTNWPEEKKALDAIEAAYDRLESEQNKGPRADSARIASLRDQVNTAIEHAQTFVMPNEYPRLIEENGGAGLNAGTSYDSTEYFYSLPSNRAELWFLLESQRFLHPVFREFYKERDVVQEENRMRVESNPQGKLLEDFLATAFAAHPYRNPAGGWPSDVANLRLSAARAFFEKYYVPANITIAIVGDINPTEARRMAERYFGPLPKRPLPPLVHTEEPSQPGPKTAIVDSPSQPLLVIGYKRPDQYDKDDPVFDIISEILSSGRTGLMYQELVRDKKLALAAEAGAEFPDARYPNLFLFFIAPGLGHTVEENQKALEDLLERFKSQTVDAQTLARVKTKARAGVIRRLDNNAGLAALLAANYAAYGDWRKLFTSLDELDAVTASDVQRVARQCFTTESRTVAFTVETAGAGAPGAPQ